MIHPQLLTTLLNQTSYNKPVYPIKLPDSYQGLSGLSMNQTKSSPDSIVSKVLLENFAKNAVHKKIKTETEVPNLLQVEEKLRTLQALNFSSNHQIQSPLTQLNPLVSNPLAYNPKPTSLLYSSSPFLRALLISQLNQNASLNLAQPVILQKQPTEEASIKADVKELAKNVQAPPQENSTSSPQASSHASLSPNEKRTASIRYIENSKDGKSNTSKPKAQSYTEIEEDFDEEEEDFDDEEPKSNKKDENFKVRLTGNSKNQPLRKQPQRTKKVAEEKLDKESEMEIIFSVKDDIARLVGYSDLDPEKLYILWQRSDCDKTRFFIKLKRNLSYYKKTLKISS